MRGLVVMSQSWQTYVAFLAAGGGLDFRDAKGRPLLLIAFEGENDDLAQGLMRRGADVTVRTTPPKIEEEDEEERHEFRETDARDYLGGLKESTVRMFFEKAPSARLDKHFAYTPPLNEAAEKGNVKVMALLLAKGADINGMRYAKTPLHCAARARFGRVAGAPRPARRRGTGTPPGSPPASARPARNSWSWSRSRRLPLCSTTRCLGSSRAVSPPSRISCVASSASRTSQSIRRVRLWIQPRYRRRSASAAARARRSPSGVL